jgi:hypothetical protein
MLSARFSVRPVSLIPDELPTPATVLDLHFPSPDEFLLCLQYPHYPPLLMLLRCHDEQSYHVNEHANRMIVSTHWLAYLVLR